MVSAPQIPGIATTGQTLGIPTRLCARCPSSKPCRPAARDPGVRTSHRHDLVDLTRPGRFAESRAADPIMTPIEGENVVMPLELSSRATAAIATIASCLTLAMMSSAAIAQPGQGRAFTSDPRAEDRTYHFADTDEDLPYCVFASSKIDAEKPAPLIISLHGLGAPPQIMCNSTAVDLAEEGGYILA